MYSFAGSSSGRVASGTAVPQHWPGKKGKGMYERQWRAARDLLERVYLARDGTRDIARAFEELPNEDENPGFYKVVAQPECLNNVANNLGDQLYGSPERFFLRLHLVFLNAKQYNREGSQPWIDAKILEDQIHEDWRMYAAQGIFSHPDPTVNAPRRPGRPRKDEQRPPLDSRGSSTPGPGYDSPSTSHYAYPSATLSSVSQYIPPPTPSYVHTPSYPQTAGYQSSYPPTASTSAAHMSAPMPMSAPSPAAAEADLRVIAALEERLPKWQGPQRALPGQMVMGGVEGSGWWGEGAPDYEATAGGQAMWPHRIKAVVAAIDAYRNTSGVRLAEVFDKVPHHTDVPYLSFQTPLSFGSIRASAQQNRYPTLRDFDLDMARLFEKARRSLPSGSTQYGSVLILQRLYNAITAPYPLALPPTGIPAPSSTLFASLPAGPGNARSMHETTQELRAGAAEEEVGYGITTYRVGTKDREWTSEARHKGIAYRVGDYVHLINPDDATRPIIGQIWKSFVPTKGYRTHHVTVCWYYRPEQTVHTADRVFFEREIFKSGHFCDHPVQDIIERVSCQFYVKYIRGRPQAPEYYPGWPIYICNSRYNDREWLSIRIKNWASCIPEELRQSDYMSIVPYDRQIEPPIVKSPFVRGISGPGFLAEPRRQPGAEDEEEEEMSSRPDRDRSRRDVRSDAPTPVTATATYDPLARPLLPNPGFSSSQNHAQPQTPYRAPGPSNAGVLAPMPGSSSARSVAAVMGGPLVMEQMAAREVLPADTARLFERDAHRQVLWFSGPPLPAGSIKIPEQPGHSLEYLAYLAKRKKGASKDEARGAGRLRRVEGDGAGSVEVQDIASVGREDAKKADVGKAWWTEGMSDEEVARGLKALIDAV